MRLSAILFSQGFGSRRECVARVCSGAVTIDAQVHDDPDEELATEGLVFTIDGRAWPYRDKALVLMHKPAGYECSAKPRHHPSVLSLLPAPLRARGVQPVGRLDQDTTGVLLLTDDGALIHRLSSPRHKVPKIYQVQTRHPVQDKQLAWLREGVVLDDDPRPVRAARVEPAGPYQLSLTLTEGRYHQVKRMVAAVGNRVDALHRSHFGALGLPPGLGPGQWCWIDPIELQADPVATSFG